MTTVPDPCIRGCVITGQHATNCPEPDRPCTGCLPRPTDTGHLCGHCRTQLGAAIAAAPQLLETLRYIGQPHASVQAPTEEIRASGDPAETIPLHAAWLDADELTHHLASWALLIHEELGHTGYIPNPVAYLLTHLDWASGQDAWIGDMVTELTRAVFGLRTRWDGNDHAPKPQPIREPCPRCDHFTLEHPDHERYHVHCTNDDCARIWSREQWEARAAQIEGAA